jgi:hypothetical protein
MAYFLYKIVAKFPLNERDANRRKNVEGKAKTARLDPVISTIVFATALLQPFPYLHSLCEFWGWSYY